MGTRVSRFDIETPLWMDVSAELTSLRQSVERSTEGWGWQHPHDWRSRFPLRRKPLCQREIQGVRRSGLPGGILHAKEELAGQCRKKLMKTKSSVQQRKDNQ